MKIRYAAYHSQEWDDLVEAGYITHEVKELEGVRLAVLVKPETRQEGA